MDSSSSPYPPGAFLPNGLHTDPPLPPNDPTIGYKLNHFCIRVRDPKESLHFYINLMGMRTIFVTNGGPLTVYFLGYPQTDRHRADLQAFGKETVPQSTLGLLELYHIHGSEKQPKAYYETGNGPPHLGFCHLGFSVPDVPATLRRLQENGVPVFKELGEAIRQSIPISEWENANGIGVEVKGKSEIHPTYTKVLKQIAFVRDPVSYFVVRCRCAKPQILNLKTQDGYLVELVPDKFDLDH